MLAACKDVRRVIDAVERCRALYVGCLQGVRMGVGVEDSARLLRGARGLPLWTRNSAYIAWTFLLGLYWEVVGTVLNAEPC